MAVFPPPVLSVLVQESDLVPPLLGLCAGYERGLWRCDQLAEYLTEWLLDFVFNEEEQAEMDSLSARRALKRAAAAMYQTDRFDRRGEFGELLMHVVLRQHFGTLPAIRKIFFKDSPNDTVKGFDAVHVVPTEIDLELWLGEVKFYANLGDAIRDVLEEIEKHTKTDYLRTEFGLILNKLDRSFPHFEKLEKLLDPATSLDHVFARARIPILLTYNSKTTAEFSEHSVEYAKKLKAELLAAHQRLVKKGLPAELVINLSLIPLATKAELVAALDTKLKGLQA